MLATETCKIYISQTRFVCVNTHHQNCHRNLGWTQCFRGRSEEEPMSCKTSYNNNDSYVPDPSLNSELYLNWFGCIRNECRGTEFEKDSQKSILCNEMKTSFIQLDKEMVNKSFLWHVFCHTAAPKTSLHQGLPWEMPLASCPLLHGGYTLFQKAGYMVLLSQTEGTEIHRFFKHCIIT